VCIVTSEIAYLEASEPLLPIISLFLVECHIDQVTIILLSRGELDSMRGHPAEVFFGVFRITCTQSLEKDDKKK
jgi:hypothetical protein